MTLEEIIELAKEVELEDNIDWGNLPLDKDRIYQMIGSRAYELFVLQPSEDRETVMIATLIKLLVENFVLNLQLQSKY